MLEEPLLSKYQAENCPEWFLKYESQLAQYISPVILQFPTAHFTDKHSTHSKGDHDVHSLSKELLDIYKNDPVGKEKISQKIAQDMSIDDFLNIFTLLAYLLCPAIHGQRMDVLFSKAKNGDRDSILKLIQIDKSLITAEWSAKEIRKAQMSGDLAYLKKLSKALSKDALVSSKRNVQLTCVLVLGWELGLKNLKNSELFDYIKSLGIYGSDDPGSLYTEIKRLKLRKRDQPTKKS
ncbi:MAG: hypothetical protein G3M78_08220 [Candidatus Nitrohelix vancouverensis]|uniref:Uncharacterized protein n=1 Tax=Candidatus Nitrohelix vancouverensis TaxID=2705534 RepID=A0A7T0C2K4_9BACT|nr:MAG: hypothetical protein G3M78_08220 [Candidatus Nitrohelix vancouverensis]